MATQTDSRIEVDVDLNAIIPCEHSMHGNYHNGDEGAKFLIRAFKPCCNPGHNKLFWLCDSGFTRASLVGVRCIDCGHWDYWEHFWKIVKTI